MEKSGFRETEIGMVPEGWEIKTINELMEFSKKPRNLNLQEKEEIPFIPMEMITESGTKISGWVLRKASEISSGTFVNKNDLIIAKITPCFENGKQAILDNIPDDFGYATTEVWAIHPKTEETLTEYISNYLKLSDIRHNLATKMEGATGRQRLPRHILANLQIPLPPLPEQKAIAHILSTVQRAKEATEQVIEATKELKKSLMKHLFTYGPVPLEEAPNVKLKETEIGMVPEGWELTKLGRISTIRYGLGQPPKLDSHGVPMIRATNIKRGRIVKNDLMFVDISSLPKGKNPYLLTGDILIVRSGAYTGDIALITPQWSKSIAGYDLIVSPLKKINSHFLSEYLQGMQVQAYFRSQRDRSAQPHLNSQQISDTRVILPPLEVQNKISTILSNHDKKVYAEESKYAVLDELFKTLLNNLMTGKIRVKNFEVPQA